MRKIKYLAGFLALAFILPTGLFASWWALQERPASWRVADWNSSGLLPPATEDMPAAIYVLSARTGGMKGALSLHSWIVLKPEGGSYERYDKVGWGNPVRRNAYPADGRWYSNRPFIVKAVHGEEASRLIPLMRNAIEAYPYGKRGDYAIWPGPNSNSFVAHILAEVPALGTTLPPNAIGRDYRPGWYSLEHDADWTDYRISLGGYAGITLGRDSGLEVNLLGLVAGFDVLRPAVKLPGFGRIDLWTVTPTYNVGGTPATENPPSTTSVWPVTKPASADIR